MCVFVCLHAGQGVDCSHMNNADEKWPNMCFWGIRHKIVELVAKASGET